MRFTRTKAIVATAGLALSLAACGDAGDDDASPSTSTWPMTPTSQFDDGTRMKELADAGTINVGVKFDQPGLGFNETGSDMPTGFDVDIAKILVASLGIDPDDTSKVKYVETISDNREPFLQEGKVDLVLASYSITDERRAVVGQAGPYMLTGQQLLVPEDSEAEGPEDLKGKEVCSVTGSTSLDNAKAQGMKPVGFDTYSQCVDKVARRHRRGDDDRRHDPRRLRRAERGPAQGRRRPVLRGAHRRRLLQGLPRDVPVDQRHPRARPTRTASGPRPSRPTSARRASRRPDFPELDPCES